MVDSVKHSCNHDKLKPHATEDLPKSIVEDVIMSKTVKNQRTKLLRQNRYPLMTGVVVLLLAFSDLTASAAAESLTYNKALVSLLEANQQSIKEMSMLLSTLNSTILRIDKETNETKAWIKDTIDKSTNDIKVAIGGMNSLIDQTVRSLMNTTTERAVQRSLSSFNNSMLTDGNTSNTEMSSDRVFTFDLSFPFRRFTNLNDDVFTNPPEKRVVDGVPMEVKINLYSYTDPQIWVYINCYEGASVPFEWPSTKSIQLVVLTEENTEFAKLVIASTDIPGCQKAGARSKSTYIGHVSWLREKSVLVNNTIRIRAKSPA